MVLGSPALLFGLLNAQTWVDRFGSYVLLGAAILVFVECWLFPFLPGDSLLFLLGLLIAQGGSVGVPIWVACVVVTASAVLSNVVGYAVGVRLGPALFKRPDARIFKQEYIATTIAFFDKFGNRAIFLARFVPIVRTFITLAAGIGRMSPRRFLAYSAAGGVVWASGVTLIGYWLGNITFLSRHIDLVLIGIVLVSVVPMLVEVLRARSREAGVARARDSLRS